MIFPWQVQIYLRFAFVACFSSLLDHLDQTDISEIETAASFEFKLVYSRIWMCMSKRRFALLRTVKFHVLQLHFMKQKIV